MTAPVVRAASPAGKVLKELRHRPMTVEELARALGLTANAVRNQLRKLQEMGFVERTGSRPGASKPSTLYGITLDGQVQFSTIYLPVLTRFFKVAERECEESQLQTLMTETGTLLAASYAKPSGAIKSRVRAGARAFADFGAVSEIRPRNGTLVIRSPVCPLAALTGEHKVACNVLQGFFTEFIGASVTVCCDFEEEPRCCFEIRGSTETPVSTRATPR
jgi:predicted ArsR family transcriptional regulator